jgi:hypothetical protein
MESAERWGLILRKLDPHQLREGEPCYFTRLCSYKLYGGKKEFFRVLRHGSAPLEQ